jgi:hypothetical protein
MSLIRVLQDGTLEMIGTRIIPIVHRCNLTPQQVRIVDSYISSRDRIRPISIEELQVMLLEMGVEIELDVDFLSYQDDIHFLPEDNQPLEQLFLEMHRTAIVGEFKFLTTDNNLV